MFTNKSSTILVVTITVIVLTIIIHPTTVQCQRSPYAGSRPNGYHDQFIVHSSTEETIVNRFGDDNNGSQRPPVAGVAVVQASGNFAPIIMPIASTTTAPASTIGQLFNRIDAIAPFSNGNIGTGTENRIENVSTSNINNNNSNGVMTTNLVSGSGSSSSTTTRLPYDAYNDKYLVDFYNRNPIDNRPFWLINAEHIERQRNATANQVANFNPTVSQNTFAGQG